MFWGAKLPRQSIEQRNSTSQKSKVDLKLLPEYFNPCTHISMHAEGNTPQTPSTQRKHFKA